MSLRTIAKTSALTLVAAAMATGVSWISTQLSILDEGSGREILLPFLVALIVSPCFLFPWISTTHRLQNAQRELVRLARTDMLTGLANRWAFFPEAEVILADRTTDSVFAVLMMSYGRFWVTRLDQAARLSALCVATPSVNVTPSMTIGNWFAPFRRRHVFAAA
ncbi:hypothetical protein [Aurantimonas sp. C2-5-R2]|uniref:hypothetical protein n=1 Tax=Aurantimonas sp. C2-5-R2 TaxID=3113713 RepID=UPI003FA52EE2